MLWILALILCASAQLMNIYILDWLTAHPLGKVEIRETFNGNYTGVFRPIATTSDLGKQLESSSPSTLYRIRAPGQKGSDYFTTSLSPCRVLNSKLVHNLWISLSAPTPHIQSLVAYADPAFKSAVDCKVTPQHDFHIIVHVTSTKPLKAPDTQSFLEKMERERRARQHGAEQDNRSFLAKYWMYIVPVVIFMVISAASNQENQA